MSDIPGLFIAPPSPVVMSSRESVSERRVPGEGGEDGEGDGDGGEGWETVSSSSSSSAEEAEEEEGEDEDGLPKDDYGLPSIPVKATLDAVVTDADDEIPGMRTSLLVEQRNGLVNGKTVQGLAAASSQKTSGLDLSSQPDGQVEAQTLQAGEEASYLAELLGLQTKAAAAPIEARAASDSASDSDSGSEETDSESESEASSSSRTPVPEPVESALEQKPEASQDVDSDSDDSLPLRNRIPMDDYDDEDDPLPKSKSNGPLDALSSLWKTQNELDAPMPKDTTSVQIADEADVRRIGILHGLVGDVILVKADTSGDYRVLDTGSFLIILNDAPVRQALTKRQDNPVKESEGEPLFLDEDESPETVREAAEAEPVPSSEPERKWRVLGEIFETLGPVTGPVYSLRLNPRDTALINVLNLGRPIYYCPDPAYSNFVFTQPLQALKGSDASNLYDEEVAEEELEFSDDEKELQHKRSKKRKKQERHGEERSKVHIESNGDASSTLNTRSQRFDPDQDLLDYTGTEPMDNDYQILQRPTDGQRGEPSAMLASSTRSDGNAMGKGRGNRRDRKNKNRKQTADDRTSTHHPDAMFNPLLPTYTPHQLPQLPGLPTGMPTYSVRTGAENVYDGRSQTGRGRGQVQRGGSTRGSGGRNGDHRQRQLPSYSPLPSQGDSGTYVPRPAATSAYVNGVFQGTPFSYGSTPSSSSTEPARQQQQGHFNPRFFPQAAAAAAVTPMSFTSSGASAYPYQGQPYAQPGHYQYPQPQAQAYPSMMQPMVNTYEPQPSVQMYAAPSMNGYAHYPAVAPYQMPPQPAPYIPEQQVYPPPTQFAAPTQDSVARHLGPAEAPPAAAAAAPMPLLQNYYIPSPSPGPIVAPPSTESAPRPLPVHTPRPSTDPRAALNQSQAHQTVPSVTQPLAAASPMPSAGVASASPVPASTTTKSSGASEIAQQLARLQQLQAKRTL